MKRSFSPKEKATIVMAALKEDKTMNELASIYQIHPNQISRWKREVKERIPELFSDKRKKENWTQERMVADLFRIIGRREAELDWLKKKLGIEPRTDIGPD